MEDTRDLIELTLAAENSDTQAQKTLARLCDEGSLLPPISSHVLYWIEKAANQGDLEAQLESGTCILAQESRENDVKALAWFREAALQGSAVGQIGLGCFFYSGRGGVDKDYSAALDCFLLAAHQGDPEAQVLVGQMHLLGQGVKESSHTEALAWYRKAADQRCPSAQFHVGLAYDLGRGVPSASNVQAQLWYLQSATMGNMDAQFCLGSMSELGQGVKRNDQNAIAWYCRAADNGHPHAESHLKLIQADTRPVHLTTDAQLVAWYGQAAEQGDSAAQYNAGLIREKGLLGVPSDLHLAVAWYRKAMEQGHSAAKARYLYLVSKTTEQRKRSL